MLRTVFLLQCIHGKWQLMVYIDLLVTIIDI